MTPEANSADTERTIADRLIRASKITAGGVLFGVGSLLTYKSTEILLDIGPHPVADAATFIGGVLIGTFVSEEIVD